MDWITLLRSLQSDFIKRLTSGCLLHCETEGQYSELTIISGERLKALRDFCWQMAEKYKRTSPVRDVFINNLKGKLGEEVVKERLADFVTEIDYEKRFGGDGKVDFTLSSDPSVGIEVKSRHGSIDKVKWSVSSEEVEKNAAVVCILIQEEVNEAQPKYHLFLAGFLPTQMIKLRTGKISFGIEQLLYGGGLQCYLEEFLSSIDDQKKSQYKHDLKLESTARQPNNHVNKPYLSPKRNDYLLYVKLADECFEKRQYKAAITAYNEALQLNPKDLTVYYKRGLARSHVEDYEGAITDYAQVININPYDGKAYQKMGLARYHIGDYEGAIADYTQAIRINPNDAVAYRNRADVRSHLGDYQGAIEDYTQAIKINPNDEHFYSTSRNPHLNLGDFQKAILALKMNPYDATGYKNRGNARYDLEDCEGAIEDYTQAIAINPNDAIAYYNRANARCELADYEGAIEDYTQVLRINLHDADAYYHRGNARYHQGDKQGVIDDFQKAADIYRKEGKLEEHKKARERILDLEIEESLDILNF